MFVDAFHLQAFFKNKQNCKVFSPKISCKLEIMKVCLKRGGKFKKKKERMKERKSNDTNVNKLRDSNTQPADPPAEVESVQLLGNLLFATPEVEHLHKDLQALQEDIQGQKDSTPHLPKEQV